MTNLEKLQTINKDLEKLANAYRDIAEKWSRLYQEALHTNDIENIKAYDDLFEEYWHIYSNIDYALTILQNVYQEEPSRWLKLVEEERN